LNLSSSDTVLEVSKILIGHFEKNHDHNGPENPQRQTHNQRDASSTYRNQYFTYIQASSDHNTTRQLDSMTFNALHSPNRSHRRCRQLYRTGLGILRLLRLDRQLQFEVTKDGDPDKRDLATTLKSAVEFLWL